MSEKNNPNKFDIDTRLVHGKSVSEAWNFNNHLIPPMTSNTTYRLESVERGAQGFQNFAEPKEGIPIWVYDRLDEPSNLMLEEQIAYLENADGAVTFSSGMSAISACVLASTKSSDLIVSDPTLYGCTFSFFTNHLPKFGINTQWQDLSSLSFLDNPPENLRIIYLESVANPNLKIAPLKKLCGKVKKINLDRPEDKKILVVVDNTFATPLSCNPLSLGADMCVHSLTKNIEGFGTELGGVVASKKEWILPLRMIRKDFGGVLNSRSSWQILNHGIPTLKLRFEKQQESAKKIADYLALHAETEIVHYPNLKDFKYREQALDNLKTNSNGDLQSGYMIAFTLKGDEDRTKKFVNLIAKDSYSITLAVSLGLTKTLIEVPRLMTHSSYGDEDVKTADIPNKLIRLSIGIESSEDIINDLSVAFEAL